MVRSQSVSICISIGRIGFQSGYKYPPIGIVYLTSTLCAVSNEQCCTPYYSQIKRVKHLLKYFSKTCQIISQLNGHQSPLTHDTCFPEPSFFPANYSVASSQWYSTDQGHDRSPPHGDTCSHILAMNLTLTLRLPAWDHSLHIAMHWCETHSARHVNFKVFFYFFRMLISTSSSHLQLCGSWCSKVFKERTHVYKEVCNYYYNFLLYLSEEWKRLTFLGINVIDTNTLNSMT